MQDTTGDTEYTYDGLRRITSVTTYRAPGEDGFSHEETKGDTIGYTYDEADHLAAITYADGTKVSYEYDKNDNLIKVTDREGKVTTYTYDDRGFIAGETAIESLAGYAYDDKHNGRHEDGRHDDLYPHGSRHNGKHDKDATFAYQIVETDRTFTYDAAGKLLTATETEDNYGTCVYTFEYDLMGNRTYMEKTLNGTVVEWHRYEYNESNQLISEKLYNGKKTTSLAYTYDADGNRISETGRIGTDKVNKTYEYSVENRLAAVHDGDKLLLAAAYDGDGNRVFLLNYNLHTDDDWKGNSGNGNGNNKDNSGSGNNGNGNSGNNGNGNGNGKGKGNNKKNSKSEGTDDAGYGNATNAEENNSQNQCGILFPVQEEVSATEADLIARIKTTGKEKNYELIEYLNDVNREHAEVLVEQNINGKTDTSYIYGAEINGGFDRISLDRFDGSTGYYLYDSRGSVSGITNEEGQVYQSYRYSVTGEITFGAPQYENEYTYNGESYNPNIQSQYLRARYYCVVTATFLTEDSYLGSLTEPLTLNRYNYCVSSYLNYTDPSGNDHYTTWQGIIAHKVLQEYFKSEYDYQIGYHPYTEYRVTGYANSKTGIGYADIVLRRPDGVYEVYEIKPYSEKKLGGGIEQRQGYIKAMKDAYLPVDDQGHTFNPNKIVLPIVDTQYNYATYYTDPSMPGMIYYSLSQTKRPKYVTAVIKQADEKKEVWWCEPGDTLTKVLNVLTDAMMLEWVGETLIDRVTQSVLPFWVMPEDILDNMLVYPKGYEGIPNSIV